MSIEGLAFKTELSKNYTGIVEHGERTTSLETLLKIMNALSGSRQPSCLRNSESLSAGGCIYSLVIL